MLLACITTVSKTEHNNSWLAVEVVSPINKVLNISTVKFNSFSAGPQFKEELRLLTLTPSGVCHNGCVCNTFTATTGLVPIAGTLMTHYQECPITWKGRTALIPPAVIEPTEGPGGNWTKSPGLAAAFGTDRSLATPFPVSNYFWMKQRIVKLRCRIWQIRDGGV